MRKFKIDITLTTLAEPPGSLSWSQNIDFPSIFTLYADISAFVNQLRKPPRQPNDKTA